ncbi:MAG: type IV secretion system DNA-binding domain-containing protein, partial [Rhodospirillaceae bacterium]|nr:type IV secretion system DNA-binding domain-containing protein [Rhodospirillaceae bacterium]
GGDRESGFLFLTSRGDQHASLRGLISMWLEIAVNALLSLEQDDERRVWVVLDELPTLHRVPSIEPGLAESRQFGGCFVLGTQVASALRDLYGRNGAETLSSLCGTRVVLAAPDRDTAQWSANSLGRSEVEALAEGVSYGADPYRDGVTLTRRREMQPLVLPSEIQRLENLHGFVKLPGCHPVARIKLRYVSRPGIAARFVPAASGATVAPPGMAAQPPARDERGSQDRPAVSTPALPLLPAPEGAPGSASKEPSEREDTGDGPPRADVQSPEGRSGADAVPQDADPDVWGELNQGARRPGELNWT